MTRLFPVLIFVAVFLGLVVQGAVGLAAGIEKIDARVPRVALLVDEPDLEALLLAGFSGVETLARGDLPKAITERVLAGGRLDLSGADVALLVERAEERGVVRVVDCASGATVVVLDLPKMPIAETARWIVARVQPLVGATTDPDRPRISLPGLRFVTDSAENRAKERMINLMLTARLQARGAVVLERWRMRDLVFEKSIAGYESPFWSAAQVVDGSVSFTDGRLHARMRIRDATGAEMLAEVESDAAENLVDDIAARVIAGQGASAVGISRSETEAEAFRAEARWMLKHGLPREAWQATESALALGVEPRREAEMLRVKAAAMCAYPDDLERVLMRDGNYRAKAFAPAELPARVAAATEAMLLAGDYWNAHPTERASGRGNLEHPATLGVQSLYTGLRVLRIAHDSGWAGANADAVRGLREAIRRNQALLRGGPLGDQRWMLFVYLANYAGYWTETPAEAVAFYRLVLDPDFDAGLSGWPEVIRNELSHGASAYGTIPRPPFLAGTATLKAFPQKTGAWRVPGGNEESARAAWSAFLDELDRSPRVLNQADGLALRWQSTADEKVRLALTPRIADFVSAHVDDLAGPHGFAIFGQLVEPLSNVSRSSELASAQQKIVGLFLSLIRSEAQVSPSIIGYVRILFLSGGIDIHEDQARQLIAALDARRARPAISRREIAGIDAARLSIWKKFPSLRLTENATDPLIVRSLWMAAEHKPDELRNHVGFDSDTAVWQDNRLWVLDSQGGRLWQIDPQSGDAVILSPGSRPQKNHKAQLIAWGKQFAIATERGVWVLDETRKQWEKLDLPAARYRIGEAHGDLWAVSGEPTWDGHVKQTEGNALYRISPELKCELIASSRRRPPVHPLDAVLAGRPFSVSASRSGGVMIGVHGKGWTWNFIDSASSASSELLNERFVENMKVTSSPGLIVRRKYPGRDRTRFLRIELLDVEGAELLLAHPELDRLGRARFPYPKELENLVASEYLAAWRDGGLDVLAWDRRSPQETSTAWIARIDAAGSTVHPLRFAWSADADQRMRAAGGDPKVFRYPRPRSLVATGRGLVITGWGMAGFWFIPTEELDNGRRISQPAQENSKSETEK